MKYLAPLAIILVIVCGIWITHAAKHQQKQTDYFQRVKEAK